MMVTGTAEELPVIDDDYRPSQGMDGVKRRRRQRSAHSKSPDFGWKLFCTWFPNYILCERALDLNPPASSALRTAFNSGCSWLLLLRDEIPNDQFDSNYGIGEQWSASFHFTSKRGVSEDDQIINHHRISNELGPLLCKKV